MAKGQRKWKQDTINKNHFEELCSMQCTREEITSFFGVSEHTLIEWCKNTYGKDFCTVFKEKRERGQSKFKT